jgi:hypothetical protein
MNLPTKAKFDLIKLREGNPEAWESITSKFNARSAAAIELSQAQLSQLPTKVLESLFKNSGESQRIEREAFARLNWWVQKKGLLETDNNLLELRDYVQHVGTGLSPELVDRAIISLRELNRLDFKDQPATHAPAAKPAATPAPPVAPPAPAPAAVAPEPAPPPVVKLLSDGTEPLPIDCPDWLLRKASRQQILDVSRRRGEGRKKIPGRFGSAF